MKPTLCFSFAILAIIWLSGCAHLNASFDCPMSAGSRCESLDQVNREVDHGAFADEHFVADNHVVKVAATDPASRTSGRKLSCSVCSVYGNTASRPGG